MACKNCFNGCTEINSDKCIKYTGIDVPALGITNGDTLLAVETALITFLSNAINGTGIKPIINQSIICPIIADYLPTCTNCTGFTLNDILHAIINATCDIQEQVNDIKSDFQILNAQYDVDCLDGVTTSSDTHDVLQAVINKVCELGVDLEALALDLDTYYVKVEDLDGLIEDYIDNSGQNTLIKNRMVPYTAVPYYGPITYFDGSGAGTGDWDRIFLCNGLNGTPDLRGRTLVGVTDGTMLGGTIPSAVNPSSNPANPNYALGTTAGANQVTLDVTQIPNHTHTITSIATVNEDPHSHFILGAGSGQGGISAYNNGTLPNLTLSTDSAKTNLTVDVASTAAPIGQGLPHANIQPSIGCRYIIYLP